MPLARQHRQAKADWFAEKIRLPIDVFMVECYSYFEENAPDDLYERWTSPLFNFVFMVRGHGAMKIYLRRPKDAMALVEKHLKDWTRARMRKGEEPPFGNHPREPWAEWFGVDTADAKAEFIDLWMKIRFMPGHTPLMQAAERARAHRLLLAPDVKQIRPTDDDTERSEHDYEFFISLAGWLQVVVGDQPIKLPVHNLSKMLGVSAMTITRFRRWAIEDKYLVITKAHKFRSKGHGDATEFQYSVKRYDCLMDSAQIGTAASFVDQGAK